MAAARSGADANGLEVVFLDVGGVLYDDAVYRRALLRALRELGADVTEPDFNLEYERCRDAQDGSFRRRLTATFLGADGDLDARSDAVQGRAARYWSYPRSALEPDVLPTLERLRASYRLGVIANQPSVVRDAMRRDGIDAFFDVWGISDDLGLEKPDPRLYERALAAARVSGGRSAMVGDRLDYDVRPAAAAGMRTVWLLRGEAPVHPTRDQLREPDAVIGSLAELPAALAAL
jgi:HAD superfamily hydrolase (TIGR01509 family)